MTSSHPVIRLPYPLRRADQQALRRLEAEFHETSASSWIGPEGERQVRCHSGEVYSLDAVPKFRARRLAHGQHDPQPPAPAMALVVA